MSQGCPCPLCPPCPRHKGEKKWTYEKFIRSIVRDRDKRDKRDKSLKPPPLTFWRKSWCYIDLAWMNGGRSIRRSWLMAKYGYGRTVKERKESPQPLW